MNNNTSKRLTGLSIFTISLYTTLTAVEIFLIISVAAGLVAAPWFMVFVFPLVIMFALMPLCEPQSLTMKLAKNPQIRRRELAADYLKVASLVTCPLFMIPLFLLSVFPPAGAVFAGLVTAIYACIAISALLAALSCAIKPPSPVTAEKIYIHLLKAGLPAYDSKRYDQGHWENLFDSDTEIKLLFQS